MHEFYFIKRSKNHYTKKFLSGVSIQDAHRSAKFQRFRIKRRIVMHNSPPPTYMYLPNTCNLSPQPDSQMTAKHMTCVTALLASFCINEATKQCQVDTQRYSSYIPIYLLVHTLPGITPHLDEFQEAAIWKRSWQSATQGNDIQIGTSLIFGCRCLYILMETISVTTSGAIVDMYSIVQQP